MGQADIQCHLRSPIGDHQAVDQCPFLYRKQRRVTRSEREIGGAIYLKAEQPQCQDRDPESDHGELAAFTSLLSNTSME